MKKKEFINSYITEYIKPNDKAYNRQLWNDSLDMLEKNGQKVSHEWVKTPKKYYGE